MGKKKYYTLNELRRVSEELKRRQALPPSPSTPPPAAVSLAEFLETCPQSSLEKAFGVLVRWPHKPATDVFRRRMGLEDQRAWTRYCADRVRESYEAGARKLLGV